MHTILSTKKLCSAGLKKLLNCFKKLGTSRITIIRVGRQYHFSVRGFSNAVMMQNHFAFWFKKEKLEIEWLRTG